MGFRTSTFRSSSYSRPSFSKSYSFSKPSTTFKSYSAPTKSYTISKPGLFSGRSTVVQKNTTIINHNTGYHPWGWHMPWYHAPVVVPIVTAPGYVAAQPVMPVDQQPLYYDDGGMAIVGGLLFFAVIVAMFAVAWRAFR